MMSHHRIPQIGKHSDFVVESNAHPGQMFSPHGHLAFAVHSRAWRLAVHWCSVPPWQPLSQRVLLYETDKLSNLHDEISLLRDGRGALPTVLYRLKSQGALQSHTSHTCYLVYCFGVAFIFVYLLCLDETQGFLSLFWDELSTGLEIWVAGICNLRQIISLHYIFNVVLRMLGLTHAAQALHHWTIPPAFSISIALNAS